MADHSKPTNSSFYSDYTTQIDARFDDITLGLDPALTTPTNLPTGAIRWTSASNKWQKWSGTAWGDLSTSFVFTSITSSALTAGRITYASTGGLLADSANLTFDGTTLSTSAISASGTNAFISNTATGTTGKYIDIANTSGRSQFGVDNSSGTTFLLSGGVAYSTTITSVGANPVIIGVNQAKVATFDSSGNLGLGVTPSAWYTAGGTKALQIGNRASIFSFSSTTTDVANNVYQSAAGDYSYIQSAYASFYRQGTGQHQWYTAPSGTAGNPITFTQAMTLDSSGGLALGVASTTNSLTYFTNANAQLVLGYNGTSVNYYDANTQIWRNRSAVEYMRIDSSGNLLVGTTSATSGGAKLQTVDGITFPATQVSSANANTLDDYEEGTWTPIASAQIGSLTAYTSSGTYTKVGRLVTVYGNIALTTVGTASGVLVFSGLPFTTSAQVAVGSARESASTGVFYVPIAYSSNTGGQIASTINGAILWTNGYSYTFTFSYFVTT